MDYLEQKQIEYLKTMKNEIIEQMISACKEINRQIKEVENGNWKKANIKKGNNIC